jgi:hypothetical protein
MPLLAVNRTRIDNIPNTPEMNPFLAMPMNTYLVLIDLFLTRTTEHFPNELGRFLFVTPPVAIPAIQPSIRSLAIVHRLRPETHVIRLAGLKLPSPALQNPDIIASVVNTPSLGGIVESILNPVRIGHAVGEEKKNPVSCNPDRRKPAIKKRKQSSAENFWDWDCQTY